MMRTIVDLPKESVEALDRLGRQQNCSRAALIRKAVVAYLNRNLPSDSEHPAFGIWQDRDLDGVDYQRHLRAEWEA